MTVFAAFLLVQPDCQINFVSFLLRLLMSLLMYGLFWAAQRFFVKNHILQNIGLQLNLLVLGLLILLWMKPVLTQLHPYILDSVHVAVVFMAVSAGFNLLDLLIFDFLMARRAKPPVPMVLRDLVRWTLSLIALVLIVRGFFPNVNLSVLAVSSLVAGYIVGNATQDTLGNLVAGLALNTESPFQIGDWISVGTHTGRVVNTTWRATCLRTKTDDYIVIPNASIARDAIVNYSRPSGCHGCYSNVGVDYAVAPGVAQKAILDTLSEIPEVLKNPAPSVYLSEYGDFKIDFRIKYFISDFEDLDPIQSTVMSRLWYGLSRAGISIPLPVQNLRFRDGGVLDKACVDQRRLSALALLSGIEIFNSLSVDERMRLAESAHLEPFNAGEVLCREGDHGATFYIIKSGRVSVLARGNDGIDIPIAHLSGGGFFGEMSLLTGESRSATVVAETDVEVYSVSKPDFAVLIKSNTALADALAGTLEKRSFERQAKRSIAAEQRVAGVAQAGSLASRIRRFFNID